MTREPSHDMWDAALRATLTHSHARDGHPNPAAAAHHTIATAPRLDHDGDDAAHDPATCPGELWDGRTREHDTGQPATADCPYCKDAR